MLSIDERYGRSLEQSFCPLVAHSVRVYQTRLSLLVILGKTKAQCEPNSIRSSTRESAQTIEHVAEQYKKGSTRQSRLAVNEEWTDTAIPEASTRLVFRP